MSYPSSLSSSSGAWDYDDRCRLIQGVFATLMQVALAAVALSSLLLKRFCERPRRPLLIFALDTSKQAVSMGTAHLTNLATAYVLSTILGHKPGQHPHQCSWYLITFFFDCTLGSISAYAGIRLVQMAARRVRLAPLEQSGFYGKPVRPSWFAAQLGAWVVIVIAGRVCNALIEWAAWKPLNTLAAILGYPLRNHPQLELAIVMITCPVLLNIFQAFIQDQFLKRSARRKQQEKREQQETSPLLGQQQQESPSSVYSTPLPGADVDVDDDDVEEESSPDEATSSSPPPAEPASPIPSEMHPAVLLLKGDSSDEERR